ncbi:MAG: OmpA family protein [Myxococcales bacterium]|nr:OmpA family protein [Myxococcales bacterium]
MNRIAFIVATLTALSGCAWQSDYVTEQDRAAALAREKSELLARVDGLEKSLAAEREARAREAAELKDQIDFLEIDKQKSVEALEEKLSTKEVEIARKSATFTRMRERLEAEISAGNIAVEEIAGKLRVSMADKILFPSGSADLSPEGKSVLTKVRDSIGEAPGKIIVVEGHTDADKISTPRFPSNWELSTGRACSVVRQLQQLGFDPTRLVASGYGEFHPVAPNDTAKNKAANRRIELILMPQDVKEALRDATRHGGADPL